MAEQQLVDYIKKARVAGQPDTQIKTLLAKNGWTEQEISDAILASGEPQQQKPVQFSQPSAQPAAQSQPQIQTQAQPQIQTQAQPQIQQYKPEPVQVAQPKSQPDLSSVIDEKPQSISQIQAVTQPKVQIQQQKQPQQPAYVQPQAQTQPNLAQNVGAQQGQYKSRHRGLKLLVVLIIIAVLGGVGYFAAGKYMNLGFLKNISWNLFSPSADTIISKMVASLKNVQASHSLSAVNIIALGLDGTDQGKISFSAEGETDLIDSANSKADGVMSVRFVAPGATAPTISLSINMVTIDDAAYFKLNSITVPSDYLPKGLDVSQFTGKWIKFDQKSALSLAKIKPSDINPGEKLNTSEVTKKFQALFASENIFASAKKISDETISGQAAYHLVVTISKAKLNSLLTKIVDTATQETAKLQTSFDTSALKGGLSKFSDALGDLSIDLWVGKTDSMLYKVSAKKIIDMSKVANIPFQFSVSLSQTNSNFNKPIAVQAPADSQKAEDIVAALMAPPSPEQQKINAIRDDMASISSAAEEIFLRDNSFVSLCNRTLLNGYQPDHGKNLIAANNDIIKNGAGRAGCFSDAQGYCISTQLPDKTFYCVGTNAVKGTIKCTSAQTICE